MKKQLIYQGRVIRLFREVRRLPNSHMTTLDIIRHPGAVLIVPFLDSRHLVFIKQYRPVVEKYLFELPAGTLNPGETPRRCALREVMEETGYAARRITNVGSIYLAPGYSTERIHIFKAQNLWSRKKEADADEIIETFVFSQREVRVLFSKGVLLDAKTIAGLVSCGWL